MILRGQGHGGGLFIDGRAGATRVDGVWGGIKWTMNSVLFFRNHAGSSGGGASAFNIWRKCVRSFFCFELRLKALLHSSDCRAQRLRLDREHGGVRQRRTPRRLVANSEPWRGSAVRLRFFDLRQLPLPGLPRPRQRAPRRMLGLYNSDTFLSRFASLT